MTIQELIDRLELVPEDKRDEKIYVFDYSIGDNFEVASVSLWDSDEKHSEENILSININDNIY